MLKKDNIPLKPVHRDSALLAVYVEVLTLHINKEFLDHLDANESVCYNNCDSFKMAMFLDYNAL